MGLEEAASPDGTGQGNLVTPWKLLGDIHLQQARLPAAVLLARSSSSSSKGGAALPAQQQLMTPAQATAAAGAAVVLVVGARRAYSRALHLDPAQASLLGDIALTYHEERRLLLQQQQQQGPAFHSPVNLDRLAAKAVKAVKGALALQPADAWLWGVLGAVATHPGVSEYSLVRSLQLDPQDARVWVMLGRLYRQRGARQLSAKAFECARGVEPTLVSVWEGMAVASATDGASGRSEAQEYYAHAVGLGGGLESWLGYTAGALVTGKGAQGQVLACAVRALAQAPVLVSAQNNLALVHEARGEYAAAVKLLEHAADHQPPTAAAAAAGREGVAEVSHVSATSSKDGGDAAGFTSWGLQPAAPAAVATTVKINLARNYSLAGQYQQALQLYTQLSAVPPMAEGSPGDWVAYAHVQQRCGQASGAKSSLERALQLAGSNRRQRLAVTASLLQVRGVKRVDGGGRRRGRAWRGRGVLCLGLRA